MKNRILPSVSLTVLLCMQMSIVNANDWQPVSADSLIELPANLIEKRIAQDFRMSPMASELLTLEQQISSSSAQISALSTAVIDADTNSMIDEKVDLVQLKSEFLDLMQQGQQLRQRQLEEKMQVYQQVLAKLYHTAQHQSDSPLYKLQASQEAARQRMAKVMEQVDTTLLQNGSRSESPYAQEFAENLSKIEQLKQTIAQHQANLSAKVDGVEVSTQEYVRQLLMQASSEQSLLDQEGLMLSYMSKIVALDAQSLEFAISEMQEQDALSAAPITTPASAVSLFL